MDTILLSTLVPTWKGHLIPEAYGAVVKGLERLRSRLQGSRFLVVSYVHELDYDGCYDRIFFEAGFQTSEEAVSTCFRILQYRMLESLIRLGPRTESWKTWGAEFALREIGPRIQVVTSQRRDDGTGYNAVEVWAGVFVLTPGDPLSATDLEGIGFDSEVIWFLGHEATR